MSLENPATVKKEKEVEPEIVKSTTEGFGFLHAIDNKVTMISSYAQLMQLSITDFTSTIEESDGLESVLADIVAQAGEVKNITYEILDLRKNIQNIDGEILSRVIKRAIKKIVALVPIMFNLSREAETLAKSEKYRTSHELQEDTELLVASAKSAEQLTQLYLGQEPEFMKEEKLDAWLSEEKILLQPVIDAEAFGSDATFTLQVKVDPELRIIPEQQIELSSVLENLVKNSVGQIKSKSDIKEGLINITGHGLEWDRVPYLEILVEDNAGGMTEEQIEKFNAAQGGALETTKATGNGIGLGSNRKSIESLGGVMVAENIDAPEKGLRMRIYLPVGGKKETPLAQAA